MVKEEVTVKCPFCAGEDICKYGYSKAGKQVYHCRNPKCTHKYFVENYTYKACCPQVRQQVLSMAVNCMGVRATARVQVISTNSVISILKKRTVGPGR